MSTPERYEYEMMRRAGVITAAEVPGFDAETGVLNQDERENSF